MTTCSGRRRQAGRFLGGALALLMTTGAFSAVAEAQGRRGAAPAAPAASDTYGAVYNGWKWWHVYCYRCHGTNMIGATLAPDLRDPNRHLTRAAFLRVVRVGRDAKGMPEWASLLTAKQMNDLYVYVRARADKVLAAGRPDEVGTPKGKPWAPPAGWVAK
jgi:mono/diheme cytochrome c family protein